MALTVHEIRTWLDQFTGDTLIGISEDDEMTLRPADERYNEAYLEIGMALSSEYLERTRPPYVIPSQEIMDAQWEAAVEDFQRTYYPAMKESFAQLLAKMEAAFKSLPRIS